MRLVSPKTACLCIAILGAHLAAAQAATKPAELAATIHAPTPYGSGALTFIGFTAYTASLWTDAKPWSMASPFALTLRYNMSFSGADIIDRSLKEIRHGGADEATLARYRSLMGGVFHDVKSGDEISGLYSTDGTTRFFQNGVFQGAVKDPDFSRAFFNIWLGPNTSEPGLRDKLLHA